MPSKRLPDNPSVDNPSVVNPSVDNPSYAEFNAMVAQLEALPESWGDRRTLLWLRQYEQFDRRTDKFWRSLGFAKHRQYSPGYENLAFFLDQLGNPPAIKTEEVAQGDGVAKDKQLRVTAFQFTIVVRHMTEWWNRAVVEEKVRAILDRFPQFNATLHDGDQGWTKFRVVFVSSYIFGTF